MNCNLVVGFTASRGIVEGIINFISFIVRPERVVNYQKTK